MQKLINVLAVTSFVVSAGIVGAGFYVYTHQDVLIDEIKKEGMKVIEDSIKDLLSPSSLVPELPVDPATSTAIPSVPFTF